MKTIFVTLVASLIVVLALFVLISEDQSRSDGSLTLHADRVSDPAHTVLETALLQRKQRSERTASNSTIVITAQRHLRDDGFYSGPLDGKMTDLTREALRSFQRTKQINVTGTLDNQTFRELGIEGNY